MTTSAIPHGESTFDIEFDFGAHELRVDPTDGGAPDGRARAEAGRRSSTPRPSLRSASSGSTSRSGPAGRARSGYPVREDREHASYDPDAVQRFWRQLVQADRVFDEFRSRFIGKVSPVHFFWGAMDLAVTRFSGRRRRAIPGGAPNCATGSWSRATRTSWQLPVLAGRRRRGCVLCLRLPEPDGFSDQPVRPRRGLLPRRAGQFLLPYEAVRTRRGPGCDAAGVPADDLRGGRRARRVGPARARRRPSASREAALTQHRYAAACRCSRPPVPISTSMRRTLLERPLGSSTVAAVPGTAPMSARPIGEAAEITSGPID